MTLAGVEKDVATQALADHKTIEDAIDALLVKPIVSGDKYIPPKPKVNTFMDEEQQQRCAKGRWLQEKINGVYSVAHSQIQNQQDQQDSETSSSYLQKSHSVSESSVEVPVVEPSR